MNRFRAFGFLAVLVLALSAAAYGQRTEITISLGEQFFETVIDSVFAHAAPPEFSIAGSSASRGPLANEPWSALTISYPRSFCPNQRWPAKRRSRFGVRIPAFERQFYFETAAFPLRLRSRGGYNPPLVGCVQFAGCGNDPRPRIRRTRPAAHRSCRVTNVNLNGTGGVGGSVIARLVQSSIDRKINPIE